MGMTSELITQLERQHVLLPLSNFELNATVPQWLFTNAEMLPLIPAVIIVGGFIILTLSYVSWKKYKGEKETKRKKRAKIVDGDSKSD